MTKNSTLSKLLQLKPRGTKSTCDKRLETRKISCRWQTAWPICNGVGYLIKTRPSPYVSPRRNWSLYINSVHTRAENPQSWGPLEPCRLAIRRAKTSPSPIPMYVTTANFVVRCKGCWHSTGESQKKTESAGTPPSWDERRGSSRDIRHPPHYVTLRNVGVVIDMESQIFESVGPALLEFWCGWPLKTSTHCPYVLTTSNSGVCVKWFTHK